MKFLWIDINMRKKRTYSNSYYEQDIIQKQGIDCLKEKLEQMCQFQL